MPRPPPRSTIAHLRRLVESELGDDVAQQSDHAMRGQFESVDVEDLRTDVAVQPDEPEVAGGEHAADGGHGRAAGERETELLVFVRGRDEFVGVRLDTDGDPDEDVLHDTELTGDLVEAVDLGHRVEHDVPDTGAAPRCAVRRRTCCCRAWRSCSAGKPACSATASSPPDATSSDNPSWCDPPRDLGAQERLRRVMHPCRRAERLGDLAAPRPEVVFVDDEQRRAVLLGEVGDRHSRDLQDTVVAATRVAGPHVRMEFVQFTRVAGTFGEGRGVRNLGVPGPGRVRVHIRSGAETPSSPRPLPSTWRAAAHSARRAVCRAPGSSSPCGRMRQAS